MSAILERVQAHWILDSRGLPTVECLVLLSEGSRQARGLASVPSGASTGTYEALELRDGGKDFHGKGVSKAVGYINELIAVSLKGKSFTSAQEIDQALLELDKTENKSTLGANAILAVSMAAHRAFAELANLELWQYLRQVYFSYLTDVSFPRLMCNVVNGGVHSDAGLAIQEFMIVPGSGNLAKDVQIASEVYHTLKAKLKRDGYSVALGDEGGFAPRIKTTREVLDYLQAAIVDSSYSNECSLAMDCAANEFFDKESVTYKVDGQTYQAEDLNKFYSDLLEKYPLLSIEDAFAEDDLAGWQLITRTLSEKISLIGDDLFVTNPKRFQAIALEQKIANGILIKLNQIGSVLETCQVINLAKENGYVTAISHRSGETTDSFMSDLAVAAQSEFIKLGAPARGERVAKFNRLLQIYYTLENQR